MSIFDVGFFTATSGNFLSSLFPEEEEGRKGEGETRENVQLLTETCNSSNSNSKEIKKQGDARVIRVVYGN